VKDINAHLRLAGGRFCLNAAGGPNGSEGHGSIRQVWNGGGMIELFKKERKIRFGVRLDAVRKAGLEISSEVLGLASFVQGAEGSDRR
jgi:hypothetical protein